MNFDTLINYLKEKWDIWVAVIVSVALGLLLGYFFLEDVTISSSEIITNDSITITFKNEHLIKSTSKVVIWGWDTVNGEFIIDSLTRGSLDPQETETRTYNIERNLVNLSFENFESKIPGVRGITDIPAGKVFIRNTLFYRTTCVDCEGQDYWRPLREDVMDIGFECNFDKTTGFFKCPSGDYIQISWKKP